MRGACLCGYQFQDGKRQIDRSKWPRYSQERNRFASVASVAPGEEGEKKKPLELSRLSSPSISGVWEEGGTMYGGEKESPSLARHEKQEISVATRRVAARRIRTNVDGGDGDVCQPDGQ